MEYRAVAGTERDRSGAFDCAPSRPCLHRRPSGGASQVLYGVVALLHVRAGDSISTTPPRIPRWSAWVSSPTCSACAMRFDADHIAAVDDTVRFMLQKGKRPLGIGFFFSLGHSTVVFALAIGIVVRRDAPSSRQLPRAARMPAASSAPASPARSSGSSASSISLVLLDILKVWRQAKTGQHSHAHLEELLSQRGLAQSPVRRAAANGSSTTAGRCIRWACCSVSGSTRPSEVGLLAMTAGASAGDLPVAGRACRCRSCSPPECRRWTRPTAC